MTSTTEREEMASPEQKMAFTNFKYKHYFTFVEIQGKNVHVKCTLCAGGKRLSTSVQNNSNLTKHLSSAHAATKLVSKTTDAATDGPPPSKQQKLGTSHHLLLFVCVRPRSRWVCG